MKYTTPLLLASSAALATAQLAYDETTNTFSCGAHPNGAYCGGDSLATNIIVSCNAGSGSPGNCNDFLAGLPPVGVKDAQCYQADANAGTAACAYLGQVYPNGATRNGSFAVPGGYVPTGNGTGVAGPTAAGTTTGVATATAPGGAASTGSGSVGGAGSGNGSAPITPYDPSSAAAGLKAAGVAAFVGAAGAAMMML